MDGFPQPQASLSPKKNILIVDDMSNWREILAECIKDEFEGEIGVATAGTYTEALALIFTFEPGFDAVITDVRLEDRNMNDVSGLDLIDEIRKHGNKTKSIVITGYDSLSIVTRALMELKVFAFWEKGHFDYQKFMNDIRTAVYEG